MRLGEGIKTNNASSATSRFNLKRKCLECGKILENKKSHFYPMFCTEICKERYVKY